MAEISIRSGGHTLAGTLTVPDGAGPFPAVLLVPGSGPVDRDSNVRRLRLDITGQLARALAGCGFATLRYDKRGVGASTGDFRATGFLDGADDAEAALEALAAAPETDPGRVLMLGHSEGALVAGIVAARSAVPAGVVLLSGSATPGEGLLRWQTRQIAPTLPAAVRLVLRLLRTDLETRVAKNHEKIRATTTDVARVDGARLNARWHREFMAYDPRTDLARVHVPVLAVTGTKDLQTPVDDLETIAATVPGAVETHAVADVTHILRRQDGPASLSAYKKEVRRPVDGRVVALVTDWARRQVGAAVGRS
nr:alpha/beta hydrolase [Georgenia sp. SUBG003]